jgi:hypothetical protein
MFKLPFRLPKTHKADQIPEDFLGITLDPYKISVVYFQVPPKEQDLFQTSNLIEEPKKPLSDQVKVICVKSKYLSNDNIFDSVNVNDLTSQTILVLDEILTEIETEYSQCPTKAIFGIAPRNCIDLMSIVRYSNSERAKIMEQQSAELYSQAEKNAMFRAQDLLASQKGDMDTDLIPITSTEVFLKLDGEVVRDAIGLEGQELELSWFGSFAESSHLNSLQKIAKKTGLEIMGVSSLGYTFYDSLQEISDNKNSVIIDFGTSSTAVYVAFGGSLVGSRYIDIGLAGLLAEISRKLSVHLDESAEILRKYQNGTLSESLSMEVSKAVTKFSVVWIQALAMVFSDFSGVKTFSSKVFLTGEGFDIQDFVELVQTEPWFKSIPFKAPPDFVKGSLSEKILDLCGASSSLEWILPLSLGNIYFKMF